MHADFMFMGEENGGNTLTFLVVRERETKATMCTLMPRKSSSEWVVKRLMVWLREIGCEFGDLIMKGTESWHLNNCSANGRL